MTHALRAEPLSFLDTAPTIFQFTEPVAAPVHVVFDALSADPSTWTAWFPGLRAGRYHGSPPYGVGTRREVEVRGAGRYLETMMAWDSPHRWCYRVDETTTPLAKALMEDWVLDTDGDRTVVVWTFAIDTKRGLKRGFELVARPYIGRLFAKAIRNLERELVTPSA